MGTIYRDVYPRLPGPKELFIKGNTDISVCKMRRSLPTPSWLVTGGCKSRTVGCLYGWDTDFE